MSPLKVIVLLVCSLLFAPLVVAKEAKPMVADPEMEKVVNEISAEFQVREMVKRGQSQDEIVEYMVTRYGDFVLYRPPVKPTTMLLWAGPFLLLLVGLVVLVVNLRKRTALLKDGELSSEENERLKALLESDPVQKEDKS